MNEGILRVYALSVCFVSLVCGAIAASLFLFNIVKVIAPETTINPNMLADYSSNEVVHISQPRRPSFSAPPGALSNQPPSGMQLQQGVTIFDPQSVHVSIEKQTEEMRLKQRGAVISDHKFRATQGLILQSIIIFICAALFVAHWRLVEKSEGKDGA